MLDKIKKTAILMGIGFCTCFYIDPFVFAQPTQETRIKIGIIDSGITVEQYNDPILCKDGLKTVIQVEPGFSADIGLITCNERHGENIFGLVAKELNKKKYCIVSYKALYRQYPNGKVQSFIVQALREASKDSLKYLNMSIQGNFFYEEEFSYIQDMIKKGTTISVAAGNNGTNLDSICDVFPACYYNYLKTNNFHVVGSKDAPYSNFGSIVKFHEPSNPVGNPPMAGTSQSTAIHLNKVIRKIQTK